MASSRSCAECIQPSGLPSSDLSADVAMLDVAPPRHELKMPTTLIDVLSVSLILRQTAPYLEVSDILRLASISKGFQSLTRSPDATRYIDLAPVKSATFKTTPIDPGGNRWRSERMDEALTEDEFYSGPLRGIMSKLNHQNILRNISTMILDGLTVPTEMVREIISDDRYNVRILSIREAKQLNERKLMQVLKYAVRPSRPTGMPKLRGLYVFGPMEQRATPPTEPNTTRRRSPARTPPLGVTKTMGASLGAEWNKKSQEALNSDMSGMEDKWYQPTGQMFKKKPAHDWAETIRACEGIIHFDAVLCRGPRHDAENYKNQDAETPRDSHNTYLSPAIATVALGPDGCAKCKSSHEGPAIFGTSPSYQLPLLAPPPLHSSSIHAAQWPHTTKAVSDHEHQPRLFVRCADCLKDRWCERCHKWWDEKCYMPSIRVEMQPQQFLEWQALSTTDSQDGTEPSEKEQIKMGSKRECWGCGQTCAACTEKYSRSCSNCSGAYCIVDNEGSSPIRCDWCNNGRRTRDIY